MKNEQEIVKEFEEITELMTRTFHSSNAEHLSGLDITISQFIAMKLLYEQECPKMTELAGKLAVTTGNMTTMIDRLIKQGYVVRKDDSEDRRVVRVCLTVEGRNLLKKAEERKQKAIALILSKMSREDRDALLKIMQKLIVAINQEKGGK
jgi:DNA-binding MarR family transcriptional regulator